MQFCSSCFQICRAEDKTHDTDSNSSENSYRRKSGSRFYCCDRVPIEGSSVERHGMTESPSLTRSDSIELAVEAYDYLNFNLPKTVSTDIPYKEDLPEPLQEGRAIEIEGILSEHAKKFSINLSTGSDSDADLALHFNPRFDRRVIIRNHRIKSKWGVEEIVSLQPFPFHIGRKFSMIIFVANEQFLIAVNKIHFCAFSFRIPIERVKSLIILGDLELKSVLYSTRSNYPPQIFKKTPIIIVPQNFVEGESKCDIRRKVKTIKVGSKIDIYARLKLLPRAFYVNLQNGVALWPHPVIPFHMNLRLYAPGTHKKEKEIIFNSWSDDAWGKEEIISFCPFLPGTPFHLVIIYGEDGFHVSVDDKILYHYRRIIGSDVNSVVIHGDVFVYKVIVH